MKTYSVCRFPITLTLFVCVLMVNQPASGDTRIPPSPELPQRISPFEGLQDPLTGEMLSTFEPKLEGSDKEKRKSAALAQFMSGRINAERKRVPAALAAFEKAIKLDPEAIQSYKAIIPLLLTQRRIDESEAYALQAARETDNGYELVLVMASVYVRQTQIDRGIEIMQKVLGTRSVPSGSKEEILVHRDLGLYHRMKDDFKNAAAEYQIVFERVTKGENGEDLLKQVLKNPGANFDEFGDTFLKAEQPELALKAYEEASKHRETNPELHSFNLATVFQQTGKPEEAMKSLQEYFDANLQSRGRAPYELLKTLLKDLKKESEYVPRLEALFKENDSNDVLRYFLADQFLALGEANRAKELYLNGQEMVNDPRALVGMLGIYRQEKNYEQLLDVLTKSFRVIPRANDQEASQRLSEDLQALSSGFETQLDELKADDEAMIGVFDYARSLQEGDDPSLEFIQSYLLGKLAVEADFTDAALDFYKYAIGMRNEPPALLYTEIGGHLLDSEYYDEAIDILNEALESSANSLQSDRWRFLFFLSYGYEFRGETEKALETVEKAIDSAPDQILGRLEYQRAWVYYHAKQWEKALNEFNSVVEAHASDTNLVQDSQFRISNIYVELGDSEKGETVLEELLKKDPQNTQANNDLGYLWADQGKNLEKAKGMIQKALEAEPENPAYLDSMGWVLFKLEEYDAAVEKLREATQKENGDDSTIYDHLGDALQKAGKPKEAQESYQKALELETKKKHPSEKLLKAIREKLDSKPSS